MESLSHNPAGGQVPQSPWNSKDTGSPYELLKRMIFNGELEAGQPLIETELADKFGVSRTPIREALRGLQQDGLVERSDRGLAVKVRSPQEILDIYETRTVLEAAAARIAAERRTNLDISVLRWSLERAAKVSIENRSEVMDLNRQFHHAMWKASHNDALIDALERLLLHVGRYSSTSLFLPGRWEEACRAHAELTDAIEARDAGRAHELSMEHIQSARDMRLELFANSDQL